MAVQLPGNALIPWAPASQLSGRVTGNFSFQPSLCHQPLFSSQASPDLPYVQASPRTPSRLFSFSTDVWWDRFSPWGPAWEMADSRVSPCLPPYFVWAGAFLPTAGASWSPLVQGNLSALLGVPFSREHSFLLPAGIAMLSAPAEAVFHFPVLSSSTK